MKKWCVLVACLLMLPGCAAQETLETVADVWQEEAPPAAAIHVDLPAEAAAPTLEGEGRRAYVCQDYEIYVETLAGGDLERTIEKISGYSREDLTVLETMQGSSKRYDLVWATAGEAGGRLGRATILDDGHYHYVLTVLRDADTTQTSQIVWRTVFESFSLEEA